MTWRDENGRKMWERCMDLLMEVERQCGGQVSKVFLQWMRSQGFVDVR